MKTKIRCPQCGWNNLAVEKRPDGDAVCQLAICGWKGKYSDCFAKTVSTGIQWFSPKEKMPEVGRCVVLIYKNTSNRLYEFSHQKWVVDLEMIRGWDYWAYAKDFNFPKEDR